MKKFKYQARILIRINYYYSAKVLFLSQGFLVVHDLLKRIANETNIVI